MQSTFANGLSVSFKGKGVTPGMPAYVENGGVRTVGGIISVDNVNTAYFGHALFAVSTAPSKFFVGNKAVTIGGSSVTPGLFRGILLNRPMVNEQFPGHADYVFNQTPADAFYQGAIWVKLDENDTPAVGDSVYSTDEGLLTVTSSGNTAINAKVKELDPDTGLVMIYLDGQF